MPRIQIIPAEKYSFVTELEVYVGHVNFGGHLDNAQLLGLVTEARSRFFRWLGYFELDIEGCTYVVADLQVQYRSEAHHGDVLTIEMDVADINKYGFDVLFRVREKNSGRDVALGKTGAVFIDLNSRRAVPVPPLFLERLGKKCP